MGEVKNLLEHLQNNEKEFAEYSIVSRDRDVNKGWIECCEFFLRNFDLTEKTINQQENKNGN